MNYLFFFFFSSFFLCFGCGRVGVNVMSTYVLLVVLLSQVRGFIFMITVL